MIKKVHVKKNDYVIVLSGKDKNKKGKVLSVLQDKGMVIVEGVNVVTKHKKPKVRYQQGGLVHQEGPIYSSKVMFICQRCDKPTKIARKILENGEKARMCKKCGEQIDVITYSKEG